MARQLIKTSSTEIGEIRTFSIASIPSCYLVCQGQAVSRTTYATLFSVIGTLYGSGDGVNTFNVPNCQGTFIRGLGGNSSAVGTLQNDEFVSHTHTQNSHGHTQNAHGHTQSSHVHTGSTNSDSHVHSGGSLFDTSAWGVSTGNATMVATSGTRHTYVSMASDSHSHTPTITNSTATNVAATATNVATTSTNQSTGITETRPKNATVVFCIKY